MVVRARQFSLGLLVALMLAGCSEGRRVVIVSDFPFAITLEKPGTYFPPLHFQPLGSAGLVVGPKPLGLGYDFVVSDRTGKTLGNLHITEQLVEDGFVKHADVSVIRVSPTTLSKD